MGIFHRRDPRAEAFAEALALIEDGLEPDFVLPLYGDEARWLRPLVEAALAVKEWAAREQPSFYFEATLKGRLQLTLAERARAADRAPARAPWRTALAASAVLSLAAGLGAVMVGAVTADTALPGDWNYAFKIANERVAYSLSRGSDRVGVQLDVTYARLREAEALARQGRVSVADLRRIEQEATELGQLVESKPLDEAQRARLAALSETVENVGRTLASANPELAPHVERTIRKVNDAVATGLGSATPVETPASLPSTTPAASGTETPPEERETPPAPEASGTPSAFPPTATSEAPPETR